MNLDPKGITQVLFREVHSRKYTEDLKCTEDLKIIFFFLLLM